MLLHTDRTGRHRRRPEPTGAILEDVDLPGHSTSADIGSNPVLGRILFWPVVPQTVAGQLKRKASQTALLTVVFIKTDLYNRNTQSEYS